jgi:hypothetical protein
VYFPSVFDVFAIQGRSWAGETAVRAVDVLFGGYALKYSLRDEAPGGFQSPGSVAGARG